MTNQSDGTKKLKFRVSTLKNVVACWMEVPGSAFYEYVQLPSLMNKYEAACYLKRHKNFQSPALIREFIRDICAKYDPRNQRTKAVERDEQIIVPPKKKRGRPKKTPE